ALVKGRFEDSRSERVGDVSERARDGLTRNARRRRAEQLEQALRLSFSREEPRRRTEEALALVSRPGLARSEIDERARVGGPRDIAYRIEHRVRRHRRSRAEKPKERLDAALAVNAPVDASGRALEVRPGRALEEGHEIGRDLRGLGGGKIGDRPERLVPDEI